MKLLDLFCGAGGAAMGYHRAGFTEIVGVDIALQKRYPFSFVQADALAYVADCGKDFDVIHASPPCQAYSIATNHPEKHPDLYDVTRQALASSGRPYVIENVIGAPFQHGVMLCGSMFELSHQGEWLRRHRNFETSHLILHEMRCRHPKDRRALHATGQAFVRVLRDYPNRKRQGPFDLGCRVMGIDWMTRRELAQAIPPAYTEWIGRRLLERS